ncbi:hypothetical protein LIER_25352 [Lithospermum erythrorhizon]|uniref:Uncharacterized protein n=1 Tax=Lithospermum erythrorhizon TaxID=34254 RepID=A0AAV3R4K5_LITER
MISLNNGLVQLKTQKDVDDMLEWTKGVREIGIYVTYPSQKLANRLILGEIYGAFKRMCPKATLKEINDEEARLLGYKGDENSKNEKVNIRLLEWYPMQMVEEEVRGGKLENEDTDYEASTKMERGAFYIEEDEAFEDMRLVLNDIGPLSEGRFEHSDQLVELSGEEEEDDEVCSSSR